MNSVTIKALTVWEPWATLLMLSDPDGMRLKNYETRAWTTPYRGLVAIHAGNSRDGMQWLRHGHSPGARAAYRVLRDAGIDPFRDLVFGAVIGMGHLGGCFRTEDISDYIEAERPQSPELIFGDFSDGRFGWEIARTFRFPQPIPAKGAQGLWDWTLPQEFVDAVLSFDAHNEAEQAQAAEAEGAYADTQAEGAWLDAMARERDYDERR